MTASPTEAAASRSPAVDALVAQIVDYAGLFPPASLDLPTVVRNYASYVDGDDAWMLGRLIIPARRLDELEGELGDQLPTDEEDEPWHLSALVAPAGDPALEDDLRRVTAFNERHADPARGLARIDVIELKAAAAKAIEAALEHMPDELFPFFEIAVEPDPRGLIAALVGSDAGAKVRTGGGEPSAFPSAAQLARFITAAAGARVPFKATAGLHHPVRHASATVDGAWEFGFVNVFVGAALACRDGMDEALLLAILDEQDATAFGFDESGVSWRDQRLGVAEIVRARERLAISFGSCSFDEPRADLRALGLLV